jgi:UDP-N-acetylmuramoyl-tripeptide--D-alanyl-D-alanine ligase
MASLTLSPTDLATALAGHWLTPPTQPLTIADISTDSREPQAGKLFIPLKGEHFEGHQFIGRALTQGAAAACCAQAYYEANAAELAGQPLLIVADTLAAYQALGRWWRQQINPVTIAITGSSGKTSTKEILATLLARVGPVHKTPLNYNNEVGVPKTLLMLRPEHRFLILEMGMRGLGQIAELAAIAEPDWGLLTNIGVAHVGELGSQAAVAQAKWELMDYLEGATQTGVLLDSDAWMQRLAAEHPHLQTLWAGTLPTSDLHIHSIQAAPGGQWVHFAWRNQAVQRVWLNVPGAHQARNLALCLAVFYALGYALEPDAILEVPTLFGRNQWLHTPTGQTVIQDAYNANPDSMKAALQMLAEYPAARRIAVLGVMGELGADSEAMHAAVGHFCQNLPLDLLVVVGEAAQPLAQSAEGGAFPVHYFVSREAAAATLPQLLQADDLVLLKASRSAAFEELLACLGLAVTL